MQSSQPWPLQRGTFGQLMVGVYARGVGPRGPDGALLTPAVGPGMEVEEALWLSRAEAALALLRGLGGVSDGVGIPGPYAIAHHLVRDWALGLEPFSGE